MSENEKPDHWGLLAAELGAEPAPEEPKAADNQTSPPPAADIAPAPPKAPATPRPARPRKPAGDWTRIAESLGVEVPPDEVPATPPPPELREPVVAREIPRREATPSVSPPPRREARREHDRRSERREHEGRGEDRGGRKRRKRRRPVEGGEGASRRYAEPHATRPAAGILDEREQPQESSEARGAEAAERPQTRGAEPPRGRDKRRRRRRGGGPRPEPAGEDRQTPAVSEFEPEPVPSEVPEEELEEEELDVVAEPPETPGEAATSEDRESESGSRADKTLHRAIPSWGEAVNVLISANLEARAKSPERRSSGRPRGPHDRKGRDS